MPSQPERRVGDVISAYPHARSAMLPLLHLVQDRDGWVTPAAMEEVAELVGASPVEVLGVCTFYSMFRVEPVGRLVVAVCTNVACMVQGGNALYEGLQARYQDDSEVLVEEVECIAHCDHAPAFQVNYDFCAPESRDPEEPDARQVVEEAVQVVEQYRDGRRAPRTVSGTLVERST